jgi:hypothetical protein
MRDRSDASSSKRCLDAIRAVAEQIGNLPAALAHNMTSAAREASRPLAASGEAARLADRGQVLAIDFFKRS